MVFIMRTRNPTILDFFLGLLILWLVLFILFCIVYVVEIIDNYQRKLRREREALEDMLQVVTDPVNDSDYV